MKIFKILLISSAVVLGVETHGFANDVTDTSCSGYDGATQTFIHGNCNGTMFTGYDPKTMTVLTGQCQEHGSFMVYHPVTHSVITGSCY